MLVQTSPRLRLLAAAAPLSAAALLLGGCMASPTYGTGKSVNAQLFDDVSGMFSLNNTKPAIEYKPRPDLVKPASKDVLPAPQDNVATSNPAWPESPEQRRKRYRDIATANQGDPGYEPLVDSDAAQIVKADPITRGPGIDRLTTPAASTDPKSQREDFKKRRAQSEQGDPTTRRYLSEPPVEYRQAAATAPANDVGEDEDKKERRQKQAASKSKTWKDMIPWL